MAIVFANPGLMDLRGLRAFGVNAKIIDSPQGFFGTGSKYSISGLLRESCKITLYLGLDRYIFGVKRDEMRGKAFDFVTLTHPNGTVEEMPYTLELGKTWEPWQLFRELHSNALDEGGSSFQSDSYAPKENQTAFLVEGRAIEEAFSIKEQIFLSTKPFITTPNIDVHRGRSEYVYYRGVRVNKLARPSMFTYNLQKLSSGLTEDRTLKSESDMTMAVARLISDCENEEFLMEALVAPEGSYEHSMPSYWAFAPSATFERVFESLRQSGRAAALTGVATAAWKISHKELPLPAAIEPNRIQKKQLEKAISFCKRLGYPVDEYPIILIPEARDGLLALAENGKIVLTVGCFNKGTKLVAQALIEEWAHLKFGFADMTREFQSYLFEQIVTLGERINEDPL